jgi:hypothetical protein
MQSYADLRAAEPQFTAIPQMGNDKRACVYECRVNSRVVGQSDAGRRAKRAA